MEPKAKPQDANFHPALGLYENPACQALLNNRLRFKGRKTINVVNEMKVWSVYDSNYYGWLGDIRPELKRYAGYYTREGCQRRCVELNAKVRKGVAL